MLRSLRVSLFMLLCLFLLAGSGCQRKGIPCPKPSSRRTVKVKGPNSQGLEAIKVNQDKNGRIRRRRVLGLF